MGSEQRFLKEDELSLSDEFVSILLRKIGAYKDTIY